MGRILVVDDDPRIRQMLHRYLMGEGFSVVLACDIRQALQAIRQNAIDLILLDLKLGSEDGLNLAHDIRANHDHIAIIILSSKDDVLDKVVGLEVGADDYISKPFHLRELLARIKSVRRRLRLGSAEMPNMRPAIVAGKPVRFGKWRLIRADSALVDDDGRVQALTMGEYKLLDALVGNAQRVLSRDKLLDVVANRKWSPYDRSIDTQIRRLRKKIEDDPGVPTLIKTVRGEGYMLAVKAEQVAITSIN